MLFFLDPRNAIRPVSRLSQWTPSSDSAWHRARWSLPSCPTAMASYHMRKAPFSGITVLKEPMPLSSQGLSAVRTGAGSWKGVSTVRATPSESARNRGSNSNCLRDPSSRGCESFDPVIGILRSVPRLRIFFTRSMILSSQPPGSDCGIRFSSRMESNTRRIPSSSDIRGWNSGTSLKRLSVLQQQLCAKMFLQIPTAGTSSSSRSVQLRSILLHKLSSRPPVLFLPARRHRGGSSAAESSQYEKSAALCSLNRSCMKRCT